jgi:hypothetical protein
MCVVPAIFGEQSSITARQGQVLCKKYDRLYQSGKPRMQN